MSNKKNSRFKSYFYLSIATLVWGAAFIVVKPALSYTTPFRYLFYRYFLAILFSLPIFLHYLKKMSSRNQLKKINLKKIIILEALGNGLALSALYYGLKLTSALEANLIATTLPIFVTLGGIWLLKEKQEKHEWTGLGIAFLGTILLTLVPIFGLNGQFGKLSLLGNFLIIVHNLINLFYWPLAKKAYYKIPKLFISSISFYVSFIFFGIISLFEAGSAQELVRFTLDEFQNIQILWAAFYMAVFGSIIGLTTYIKGQDSIEASEASLFSYLQPLIYVPLAFMVLGEKINSIQIISLLIIFGGVFIAERRITKKKELKILNK